MISFALRCGNGHAFDGWFRGSDDFERQVDQGLVSCPICGDASISKGLMAPNISTARGKAKAAMEVQQAVAAAKAALAVDEAATTRASDAVASNKAPAADLDLPKTAVASLPSLKDAPAPVKAYVEAVRTLRAEVEAKAEDVGARFADEARKIHHGEADERPIRGEASLKEAEALGEEGIDVFVLPPLPEEGH